MATVVMTLAFPNLTGAARMVFYFASNLQKQGHHVLVLHGSVPTDANGIVRSIVVELNQKGIETQKIRSLDFPVPPFARWEISYAAKNAELFIGVNQRDRPAAVATANSLGVPSLLTIQNQHRFSGRLGIANLKQLLYRKAIASASRLLCTSRTTLEQVISYGASPGRCSLLSNGIEILPPVCSDDRIRARLAMGINDDRRIFVNVGRLHEQKGQDILLSAWANCVSRAKDDELWLVGDVTQGNHKSAFAYKSYLLRLAASLKLGSSVKFLGWRNDVSTILQAANGYVHSARWEGHPLAVMEAMASGLPIVHTDCSGVPVEVIEACGFVAQPDSKASLQAALDKLLRCDEFDLQQRGLVARSICERNFNIEVIGKRFIEIVDQTLRGF